MVFQLLSMIPLFSYDFCRTPRSALMHMAPSSREEEGKPTPLNSTVADPVPGPDPSLPCESSMSIGEPSLMMMKLPRRNQQSHDLGSQE